MYYIREGTPPGHRYSALPRTGILHGEKAQIEHVSDVRVVERKKALKDDDVGPRHRRPGPGGQPGVGRKIVLGDLGEKKEKNERMKETREKHVRPTAASERTSTSYHN